MLTIRTSGARAPEKQYALTVLLEEFLGIPIRQTVIGTDIGWTVLELPNGKQVRITDTFLVEDGPDQPVSRVNAAPVSLPHPLDPAQPALPVIGGTKTYAEHAGGIDCGLDLLASTFFMLTRWEERRPETPDTHGRFPASAALASRWGFLHRPVVHEYADFLYAMLVRLGWNQPVPTRRFSFLPTHDVDHPRLWWSAAERLRTLGGSFLKRRQPKETLFWMTRWKDPFDTFEDLMDWSEAAGCVSYFNFMGQREQGSDCYYPLNHPFIKKQIDRIDARGHVVGFHPSYESYDEPKRFKPELESIQRLTKQPVTTGRQHYLRFSQPRTWQQWEDAGLAWDSTMGYAETAGFRCGVCFDFPVFNTETRTVLKLREKPLIAMDVTLALYNNLSPAVGFDKLLALKREVEKHRGTFVLLWHNSSLRDYFWKPWEEVYRSILK
jgi:hypothetical protein